jgi:hypothetical protein
MANSWDIRLAIFLKEDSVLSVSTNLSTNASINRAFGNHLKLLFAGLFRADLILRGGQSVLQNRCSTTELNRRFFQAVQSTSHHHWD